MIVSFAALSQLGHDPYVKKAAARLFRTTAPGYHAYSATIKNPLVRKSSDERIYCSFGGGTEI